MPRPRKRTIVSHVNVTLQRFGAIAHYHWRTANEIAATAKREAANDSFPHSIHAPSAICLYHAVVECFLNEELAKTTLPPDPGVDTEHSRRHLEWVAEAQILQDKLGERKPDNILAAFGMLDKFNPAVLEDYRLFYRLRNLCYHHAPHFEPLNFYPDEIVEIIRRLGLNQINASWTSWLGHIAIMEWARQCVVRFIDEFDRCANRESTLRDIGGGYLTSEERDAAWAKSAGNGEPGE
jgi:hypothetical protein